MQPNSKSDIESQSIDPSTSQSAMAATDQLEKQLSNIISSAQQIAIIAEELLREFTTHEIGSTNTTISPARLRQTIQAAAVAPRLLSATQQQLDSLNSMLRMN